VYVHSVRTRAWLAPNFNYRVELEPWVRFPSIWELSQASHVLTGLADDVARITGIEFEVVGKCFDFEKWFRNIPMSNLDRWQIMEVWKGKWYHDLRVTMGCCHSSNTAQRVSLVVLSIVEQELVAGLDAQLGQLEPTVAMAIRVWQAGRRAAFPGQQGQDHPWHLGSYQDDTPVQTLAPLAAWVNEVLTSVLARLRVPVAEKCIAIGFDSVFEAIGGSFDLRRGHRRVGPTRETSVRFAAAVAGLAAAKAAGGRVPSADFDAFVGLLEWVCRFMADGVAALHLAHRARRRARRSARGAGHARSASDYPGVPVDDELLTALGDLQSDLSGLRFRRWTADPVFWHGGILVAADASTADGWGLHVGGMGAQGRWEAATLKAIENSRKKRADLERVSISPLELLAQILLLLVVVDTYGRPPNGQMIFRCDNMSAVMVTETRRARSPAMRCALAWLSRVEAALGVTVRLEHIPTKENKLADALSRYSVADAEEARKILGVKDTSFDKSRTVFEGKSLGEICVEIEREVRSALLADDFEDVTVEA